MGWHLYNQVKASSIPSNITQVRIFTGLVEKPNTQIGMKGGIKYALKDLLVIHSQPMTESLAYGKQSSRSMESLA
jgi:hypothetical protein